MTKARAHDDTVLAHAGRPSIAHFGAVNPPVYHASTILFPTLAALDAKAEAKVRYGRRGTPTSMALEEAMSALEGADGTVLAPSGLMAISTTLLAFAGPRRHVLVPDNVYGPVRRISDGMLGRLGLDVTYYDPAIGAGLAELVRQDTALIWLECPGSQTFEMSDLRAMVAVARQFGIPTAMDNSWSASYFLKPLSIGVDVSVQAGTKYIGGHSDVMIGLVSARGDVLQRLRATASEIGLCIGPDDAYLALRGLRTLGMRMARHHASGLAIARWLADQPGVRRVMHPGLPRDQGHALWARDFTGASGLFGFVLEETRRERIAAMLDGLRYFGMGSSWGGYESLLIPTDPSKLRSVTQWVPGGQTMRIHVGLEEPNDLIADLRAGFERLRQD